jgi:copper type II ascorbate-dependent monooxygenase-like protein
MVRSAATGLLVATAAIAGATDAAGQAAREPLPDFLLTASDGARIGLWSQPDSTRATLVALLDRRDPDWRGHAGRLERLAGRFASDGLRVLVVDPRPGGRSEPLSAPLVLLDDPLGVVVRRLGIVRSDDVIVVDRRLVERFRGSSLAHGGAETPAVATALEEFVDALLHDRGDRGGRELPAEAPDEHGIPVVLDPPRTVDFRHDVEPIVRAQCAACHRRGGRGPMDLTDYDEARGWAPQMAEVTASGAMPPWSADPRYGRFKNERRLTDTERETLRLFALQGAHEGGAANDSAPPATSATTATTATTCEWTIGEPDLVLELPEAQEIPAEGVVDYRSALIHTGLPEERFIQAVECRPTAMAVTHHIVLIAVPDDVPDEQAIEKAITFPKAAFGGYNPGSPGMWYPEGCGRRIAKGARIVASLHYVPNGKAASDRTRIALRFTRGPLLHEVFGSLLANNLVDLPPGAADVRFFAIERIERPIDLLSFQVHMHARGRGFRYELVRGGERRILLDVRPFDWKWQHFYELADPVRALPGDLLFATATYDNSAANPRNPDPRRHVKNGPQSDDEMMNGYYNYVLAEPAADAATPARR